jgi:hypothetical protein
VLKLGYTAAKSTIQRYVVRFRSSGPDGQRWSTFLRNQAHAIWCWDLLEVRDLFFRCHYVFVVMHLETRRMLCALSTREPTAQWLAQQLRQLTPFIVRVALELDVWECPSHPQIEHIVQEQVSQQRTLTTRRADSEVRLVARHQGSFIPASLTMTTAGTA